jgi:glutathione S-transferase
MESHNLVALVTLAAAALYFWTAFQVGAGRSKYNVPAPAMTGSPEFERLVRVQANTLESLPLFIPALWLFALYFNDLIAAGLGLVWLIGRVIYAVTYAKDPSKRSTGFTIQLLATAVLWAGAVIGAVLGLAHGLT